MIAKFFKILCQFIVTCGFLGYSKIAPGTIGSLLAFPLNYFLIDIIKDKISLYNIVYCQVFCCLLLFIIGWFCSNIYLQGENNKDPQEVIIDEVAGQMLVITGCNFSNILMLNSPLINLMNVISINFIFLFLLPFISFRYFDIVKPSVIGWCDKNIKGGLGIMLDDMVAAIFAVVVNYMIVLIIIKFYPLY